MMNHSEQLDKFGAAFVKAQATIDRAVKDTTNPVLTNKYADLASCWNACKAAFSENSIGVIQGPKLIDGKTRLVTRLIHSSGQWVEDDGFELIGQTNKAVNVMQAMGSAVTYSRRYGLSAMVGISTEDDDGNESGKAGEKSSGKKFTRNNGGSDAGSPPASGAEKSEAAPTLVLHYPDGTTSQHAKASDYLARMKATVEKEPEIVFMSANKKTLDQIETKWDDAAPLVLELRNMAAAAG